MRFHQRIKVSVCLSPEGRWGTLCKLRVSLISGFLSPKVLHCPCSDIWPACCHPTVRMLREQRMVSSLIQKPCVSIAGRAEQILIPSPRSGGICHPELTLKGFLEEDPLISSPASDCRYRLLFSCKKHNITGLAGGQNLDPLESE